MSKCVASENKWGYVLKFPSALARGNRCPYKEDHWVHNMHDDGCTAMKGDKEDCLHHAFDDDELTAFVLEVRRRQ